MFLYLLQLCNQHPIYLDNGDLYVWGSNSDGQLGLGHYKNTSTPQKVNISNKSKASSLAANFIDVDCGSRHTIALTENGDIYTMGSGEFGQLGTGYLQNEVLPKKIELYTKIYKIAAGESHTLVLSESGKIYSAGNNNTGQLGIGTRKSSLVFVKVSTTENLKFKKVAASTFSAAFCTDGELYIWGSGAFGEFLTPKKAGEFKHPLKRLSVGTNYGCCIDSKGNAYSWGSNTHGELGTGSFEAESSPQQILTLQRRRITSISCGRNFVLALGNTINHPERSIEQRRDSVAVREKENKRSSEYEKSVKAAPKLNDSSLLNISNQSRGNYYKEHVSEIERSYADDHNRSVDSGYRNSASAVQRQSKSQAHSTVAKNLRASSHRSEIANVNQQAAKKGSGR